jgi:UDP-glucuronate 4-epimerase
MKRILITGAAGFIGFHLCKTLIKQGVFVFGSDDIRL